MNLKDVISAVIKNSSGFCLDSPLYVQNVIKACAKGNKTVAYSNFNDCLSFFIFDGDIEPLEIALGKNRVYKQKTLYDMLYNLRRDGFIDQKQMFDLIDYIDGLHKRGCIYFEVSVTHDGYYILSNIQVTSTLEEWMFGVITDSIGYGWIGIPDTTDIIKYVKG